MNKKNNNTRLATAYAGDDGQRIIEAVERPDRSFCIGVQFHPEVAVRKYMDNDKDADAYMDRDTAISFFKARL